jgi:hypothetical protein
MVDIRLFALFEQLRFDGQKFVLEPNNLLTQLQVLGGRVFF